MKIKKKIECKKQMKNVFFFFFFNLKLFYCTFNSKLFVFVNSIDMWSFIFKTFSHSESVHGTALFVSLTMGFDSHDWQKNPTWQIWQPLSFKALKETGIFLFRAAENFFKYSLSSPPPCPSLTHWGGRGATVQQTTRYTVPDTGCDN